MDQDHQESKKFLEEQVKWCKEQDRILEEIEVKLHLMRVLADYARDHELVSFEIDKINGKLDELKNKVHSLEKQLRSVVH
jgi:polyhydroxyalkanoate synthesis regulator phasin